MLQRRRRIDESKGYTEKRNGERGGLLVLTQERESGSQIVQIHSLRGRDIKSTCRLANEPVVRTTKDKVPNIPMQRA